MIIFVSVMNRIILYLVVFFGTFSQGFSQIRIESQLEAGLNCSGLPYLNKRYLPVVSPVLGYWTKIKFGNRFSYMLGVQYLKVGEKAYEHTDRVNEYHNYTSEQWKSISFQKVSVPLTIGYDFKVNGKAATVYLGIKRNYFLNGKIKERSKFNDRNNPENNSDITNFDDPFREGTFIYPARRWNKGFFIGYAVALGKRTNLNLNYSMFQYSHYNRGCYGYSYSNNDLTLSLKYRILHDKKRPCDFKVSKKS
jgi:hypothetical protein